MLDNFQREATSVGSDDAPRHLIRRELRLVGHSSLGSTKEGMSQRINDFLAIT